jgi:hypothetical protein
MERAGWYDRRVRRDRRGSIVPLDVLRRPVRQLVETVMSRGKELRNLIRREGMTIAPGAYDCITATLIAHAGFPVVYMTGAGARGEPRLSRHAQQNLAFFVPRTR